MTRATAYALLHYMTALAIEALDQRQDPDAVIDQLNMQFATEIQAARLCAQKETDVVFADPDEILTYLEDIHYRPKSGLNPNTLAVEIGHSF